MATVGSLTSLAVERWRYGVTLLPADTGEETRRDEPEYVSALRARRADGWKLISITKRDGSDVLMFRKPA